jgi:hypothetical protein
MKGNRMPDITFEEFVTRFKPVGLEDGPIDADEMPPGVPEAYIWTVVYGECQMYGIVSGCQRMDRVRYWLCRVPTDGKEYSVLKDPDDVAADAGADTKAAEPEWPSRQYRAFLAVQEGRWQAFLDSSAIRHAGAKSKATVWDEWLRPAPRNDDHEP